MDNSFKITENELLEELCNQYRLENFDPSVEFTVKMFCKRTNMKQPNASKVLTELVEDGKLSVRRVKLPNGKSANAYGRVTTD